MRLFAVLAAFCLIQVAFAVTVDPNQGATILKPAGGDATSGTTIMTTTGQPPADGTACAAGTTCPATTPAATPAPPTGPVAAPPPGYKAAVVIHAQAPCGCQAAELNCACNQPQYVEPELKPEANACGCLQMEICGCRVSTVAPETVAPEQAPNHVAPEVVEKIQRPCDLTTGPCAPQPEFVQPELKLECPCATQINVDCACSHFKPNF